MDERNGRQQGFDTSDDNGLERTSVNTARTHIVGNAQSTVPSIPRRRHETSCQRRRRLARQTVYNGRRRTFRCRNVVTNLRNESERRHENADHRESCQTIHDQREDHEVFSTHSNEASDRADRCEMMASTTDLFHPHVVATHSCDYQLESFAQHQIRLARQREYNRMRRNSEIQLTETNMGTLNERQLERDDNQEQREEESQVHMQPTHEESIGSGRVSSVCSSGNHSQGQAQAYSWSMALGGSRICVDHQGMMPEITAGPIPSTAVNNRRIRKERESQRLNRLARQRECARRRRLSQRVTLTGMLSNGNEYRQESINGQSHGLEQQQKDPPARVLEAVPSNGFSIREQIDARLSPVSSNRIKDIEQSLQAALGADGLDECVCAICDRLVLRSLSNRVACDDSDKFASIKRRLEVPNHNLPPSLIKQYDCSDIDPFLANMMLSREGIISDVGKTELNACDTCFASLSKNLNGKPPKFAIANGFYVGLLPDSLFAATWVEKIMTQLVTVVAQTRIMRGGCHRAIRSHCMVFDATPGPPATLLPRRIDRDGPYRVVLAGPMTSGQCDRIRKLHDARGQIVGDLLAYFKLNNVLYADVQIDNPSVEAMDADATLCDRIFIRNLDEDVSESLDRDQDSISAGLQNLVQVTEDESHVVERNVLLANESLVDMTAFVEQRVVDLNQHDELAVPRLRLDHSSKYAAPVNIEAKMFPHLFPFGRGHPNENRSTYVSKKDCVRYYAMLSSRRFAHDPTFLLTSFARLSLENMYTLTSVKCRRYSSVLQGYEALSSNDIMTALLNNERRQRGEPRLQLVNRHAERFLKSVELGSMSVWGSSAERRQCRQEAFAYQTRFGQPALFVTLTPNTDNSYAMAHYSGILSVDTLFDMLEARVPSEAEMKKAAMMDDCASARLFMRTVDAFIEHVLGIDIKTLQSHPNGGLFGRTKAYYGMVETQGRGTLHIHFLIWLSGAPVNSVEFEERFNEEGDSYIEDLTKYVDSIVTNDLPIPITHVKCQRCASQGNFVHLPTPAGAHRNKIKRSVEIPLEPLLIKCRGCEQNCSVQHLLRQALLQHRPPHWPPPLSALGEDDKRALIVRERHVRSSESHAVARVEDREMFHTIIERTDADELADWVLQTSDSTQLSYLHSDRDPQKLDLMNRLICMMPPMLDSGRMSVEHQAYLLSTLVVNFNMHTWTHTGSCFKKSRATTSASICRYGFPRETNPTSCITGPTVKIKRTLGHEYINGYNPTIMLAFKCNHDVQVLFGGKDAINRIYYCCKYVTKSQRQIDSTTAVALASFQRRQTREATELASEAPPSLLDIQRRRVTSMVHTFTNKQEIAGPLASLYLLRGSCCYSSAACVRLPLSDIFKQLENSGDYACSLVRNHSSQDSFFTSASSLDDYIYRPESTSQLNLYEYTMRCYRRAATTTIQEQRRFNNLHPLSTSHCIAFRKIEIVPVIKGPRLPRIDDQSSNETLEKHAKIALVLFKPFRVIDDLIETNGTGQFSWYSAYQIWINNRSPFTRMIMNNMDDYQAGQAAEDEAIILGRENQGHLSGSDSDCASSDDGYDSEDHTEYADVDGATDNGLDFHGLESFMDMEIDVDDVDMQMFPTPFDFPDRIEMVLTQIEDYRLVDSIARGVVHTHQDSHQNEDIGPLNVDELRKWVKDTDFDIHDTNEGDDEDTASVGPIDRVTTITEIIDDSLSSEHLQWNPTSFSHTPTEIPMYSGIAMISRTFTLNELQHGAFALIATNLLRRWRMVLSQEATPASSDTDLQDRQLRMFLGGAGGTGKSRVIQAIQGICRSWQRPNAMVVTALTGKAASIINGQTLASFELTLKRPTCHVTLQDIDCLIVDEVSMMSKIQLLRLDRLLRKAKRINVTFGGIHVILVGDFLQLPPIGADPMFVDPATKCAVSIQDIEGFNLWRMFNKVVVLNESVRFKDDPEWGQGCSKARYGQWTPEFVDMINARVIGAICENLETPHISLPRDTVFVTPDNDTRTAINSHFVTCAGRQLPTGEFPIRIVANFRGALNQLSIEDVRMIMGLPDSKFGRMAPFLDLVSGMPIQITQNVRTRKGVANGTMGFLHSIDFPSGTTFRRAFDRRTKSVVLLPSQRPRFALVRLDRGTNVTPIAHNLDPQLFPVFPDAEAYTKADIPLTPSSTGESRSLSIKIQQFPFVCAVGVTVYKVQGESLKSMVVVDWKVHLTGANRPQQAYLMVSRVLTRGALVCMKPFTADIAAWAKPPTSAIEEDSRLAIESIRTLQEFYNTI